MPNDIVLAKVRDVVQKNPKAVYFVVGYLAGLIKELYTHETKEQIDYGLNNLEEAIKVILHENNLS